MSDNPRDTKFQGFAELLYQELSTLEGSHETVLSEYRNKYDKQVIVTLIAQRAYDLAVYVLTKQLTIIYDSYPESSARESIEYYIADLTQWPDLRDFE